jgi:hypothetical protein
MAWLLAVYRRGVAHNGGDRSNGGGGASDRRRKKGVGGPCAGVAGWAECHLGWRGEKTKKNKKMGWAARMTGLKSKVGL